MFYRIFVLAAVLALLGAALTAGPVLAGKNGGNNTVTAATLTVSPNPAACGTVVTASGSGFRSSDAAFINILTPNSLYVYTRPTDPAGNLSFDFQTAESGTYTVNVYQYRHHKLVLMAQATLTVAP